jgi:integrase
LTIRVKIRKKPDRDHFTLYFVDPITKRERARSAGTDDRMTAERAAADWERELIEFHGAEGDGWQGFRERLHDEHLAFKSVKTRAIYNTSLNAFEEFTAIQRVSQITPSLLSSFKSHLTRADYPATTIKCYLTHVSSSLRWAESIGLIAKAPRVAMPSIGRQAHTRGRPLTPREVAKMLRACRVLYPGSHAQWRYLIKLLWYSGMRISEVAHVSWDEHAPVSIHLEAKPYPLLIIYGEAQKGRQDTASPLAPDFAAWLNRTPKSERQGFVVTVLNGAGKRFNAEKLSDEVSRIGKQAGVKVKETVKRTKHASAHDIRRAFATRWALKVRPLTLQKMMRHSDLSTTLKFYVGLNSSDVGVDLWAGVIDQTH